MSCLYLCQTGPLHISSDQQFFLLPPTQSLSHTLSASGTSAFFPLPNEWDCFVMKVFFSSATCALWMRRGKAIQYPW